MENDMAVYRCTDPFSFRMKDGTRRVVAGGEVVNDRDEAYQVARSNFEPIDDYLDRKEEGPSRSRVEQATAAPGEKRAVDLPEGKPRRGRRSGGKTTPSSAAESAPDSNEEAAE